MKDFVVNNYLIRLMHHGDLDEVKRVQSLRYQFLLREYNPSLPEEGLDIDGYDDVSNSILVIDQNNNEIAGTYRVATMETIKGGRFLTEDEYNIDDLKKDSDGFVELGRAVVHPSYRNPLVIQLLFLGIYHYAIEHNCRYFIGLCSFHGHTPSDYAHGFSLLKRDYLCTKFNFKACANGFALDFLKDDEIDVAKAKKEIPNLLRMYLNLGHRVSGEGSIDYKFNSCDVLIIMDSKEINMRYFERLMKIGSMR
ncbi:MAG: GNAT family N-acetyltransferase [Bacilli bacterium]|nr:GNAT family N-acetyltransferase [Bacilli bacterium]